MVRETPIKNKNPRGGDGLGGFLEFPEWRLSSVKPLESLSIVDTDHDDLVSGKRAKTLDNTNAATSSSPLPRKKGAPGKGKTADLDVK